MSTSILVFRAIVPSNPVTMVLVFGQVAIGSGGETAWLVGGFLQIQILILILILILGKVTLMGVGEGQRAKGRTKLGVVVAMLSTPTVLGLVASAKPILEGEPAGGPRARQAPSAG